MIDVVVLLPLALNMLMVKSRPSVPLHDSDSFRQIFSSKVQEGRNKDEEVGARDRTTLLDSGMTPEGFVFIFTTEKCF